MWHEIKLELSWIRSEFGILFFRSHATLSTHAANRRDQSKLLSVTAWERLRRERMPSSALCSRLPTPHARTKRYSTRAAHTQPTDMYATLVCTATTRYSTRATATLLQSTLARTLRERRQTRQPLSHDRQQCAAAWQHVRFERFRTLLSTDYCHGTCIAPR